MNKVCISKSTKTYMLNGHELVLISMYHNSSMAFRSCYIKQILLFGNHSVKISVVDYAVDDMITTQATRDQWRLKQLAGF